MLTFIAADTSIFTTGLPYIEATCLQKAKRFLLFFNDIESKPGQWARLVTRTTL